MNCLFCTQSESLPLFDALRAELVEKGRLQRAGFTVADSWAYSNWVRNQQPDFEARGHVVLKEWEVTSAPYAKADKARLLEYERKVGRPAGLFGAIVADRRLFMGRDCAYSQDYRRRFTDDELSCILLRGLDRVSGLFDTLKPDLVLGFICVTMLDYLAYLIASARGIPFLNLRPTRVGDRVALASTLNDPSPQFAHEYQRLLTNPVEGGQQEAVDYIRRVREKHGRYEGVIRPSSRPAAKANVRRLLHFGGMVAALRRYASYRSGPAASDNHVPNPLRAMYFAAVKNPIRARAAIRLLRTCCIRDSEQLQGQRYLFYPLHTEPEVSLLVYGRPFVNQIEVIRWLAMSAPADMVVVVKEHPWMVGKRTLGAYRKLLEIPRVRLADPAVDARSLVQNAAIVAVITGSVALEAAILGRPVITFGECPYNLLPPSMVRRCGDVRTLPLAISSLLEEYASDEVALRTYVQAAFRTSVSLNLYSVLLQKKNVYAERAAEYQQEVRVLAEHILSVLEMGLHPPVPARGAATW